MAYLLLIIESEKEKFRQRILALEQELAASKGRENSLQERLLKEVSDSHNKYQQQATHSSELEVFCLFIFMFFVPTFIFSAIMALNMHGSQRQNTISHKHVQCILHTRKHVYLCIYLFIDSRY